MFRPRPPLRALMAFEASARLGSFRAAAGELNLTPSAVSHQIKILEDYLGIGLFDRIGRGTVLSADGRRYFDDVSDCFEQLDDATRRLMEGRKARKIRDVVVVHTPPSLASKWLLHHLEHFLETHPDIDVRLVAEDGRTGFDPKAFDFAITYKGDTREKGGSQLLLRETIMPLCSKATLSRLRLKSPADLLNQTLIATKYNRVTWKDWFTAQGIRNPAIDRVMQLDPSHVAIEAAVKGMGIVLESALLAEMDVEESRLVALWPDRGMAVDAYFLQSSRPTPASAGAQVFHRWLMDLSQPYRQ